MKIIIIRTSRRSERERASDVPSWSRQYQRRENETCAEYAARILMAHYGAEDGRSSMRGANSEYSQIRKACERGGR